MTGYVIHEPHCHRGKNTKCKCKTRCADCKERVYNCTCVGAGP